MKEVLVTGTTLSPKSDQALSTLFNGWPSGVVVDAVVQHPSRSNVLYAFSGICRLLLFFENNLLLLFFYK